MNTGSLHSPAVDCLFLAAVGFKVGLFQSLAGTFDEIADEIYMTSIIHYQSYFCFLSSRVEEEAEQTAP